MAIFRRISPLLICIVIINCGPSTYGSFKVNEDRSQNNYNREIIQFSDGKGIPEGYEYLTTAVYNTSFLLIYNCDYDNMVKEAGAATIRAGGDAFRLYDVKKPTLVEMCYSGNILIMRKKTVDE